MRPFNLQLRDTTEFEWTPKLQQTFDKVRKELPDGTLRLAIPISEKSFYILCVASNYGIGTALLQKNLFGKLELVSANSRLFSTTELRFSRKLSNNLCTLRIQIFHSRVTTPYYFIH